VASDRLRGLAANGLVSRTTGNAPGSQTRYRLTERGARLGPVIGGLATWGLELLTGTAAGWDEQKQRVFDRTWTLGAATEAIRESYQWRIDGVDFELAVHGGKIIRTPGRAARPAVTLTASNPALASLVTGRQTVAEAIEHGHIKLKGPETAIRRMFNVIGFPLVRLGFEHPLSPGSPARWEDPARPAGSPVLLASPPSGCRSLKPPGSPVSPCSTPPG
jgi:putative sterol carrier protein